MGVNEGSKPDAKVIAIYKIDKYEGCVGKIELEVKGYDGVEHVKIDPKAIILTVILTGKVDPANVGDTLANKIKREVVLLCPQPNKVAAADGGGDEEERAKPETEKKPAPAYAGAKKDDGKVTAIYRIEAHCPCKGCVEDPIKNNKGVEKVSIDSESIILTVIGKVDPAQIRDRLAEKFKKKVDLISSQPDTPAPAGSDGDEKQKTEEVKERLRWH